jgi:hypothetical protein
MTFFKNDYVIIGRGYFLEFALSALITVLTCIFFTTSEISNFLKLISDGLIRSIFVPALAAVLAFLWTFYNKADGKFALWLHEKGAFKVYLSAFSATVAYEVLAILFLLLVGIVANAITNTLAIFFSLLALIAFKSFVTTVVDLCSLCIEYFKTQKDKTESTNQKL